MAVILRQEVFGGTLFENIQGKRFHVTANEFEEIQQLGNIPNLLAQEIGVNGEVRIVSPPWIPSFNFSAPDTSFFEVTRACNITCIHCFNESGRKLIFELAPEQRLKIVEDLATAGVQEIRFTGGEPLALPEIFDLIELAYSLQLRVSVGTNAMLVTPEKATRLAGIGLKKAIVSVDGPEAQHDRIRGQGSFRKTINGLNNLREEGISIRVNAVVMRSSADELVPLVDYFYKLGIHMYLRRLIPAGRGAASVNEMLTAVEYQQLKERLKPYLEDPRGLIEGHYLGEKLFKPRISLPFENKGCSAGHRGIVILPNGKVQTCGFLGPLGEKSLGEAHKEPFWKIWKRLLESEHIAKLRTLLEPHNKTTAGPCTNCLAIALATQGNPEY